MTPFWQTQRLAALLPDKVALIDDATTEQVTYPQLHQKVQHALLQFGQNPARQLIIIRAVNTIDSVVFYLAALQQQHVVWLMAKDLAQNKFENLCRHYRVNKFVANGEITELNKHPHALHDELALLLSTSGSTGSPNLVRISYRNLHSNCAAICQYLPINADNKIITTLPLQYSFGLSILNTHLYQGATLVLTEHSLLCRDFWDSFTEHGITAFYGVPYIYEMLLTLKLERLSLDTLRYFAVAGGKLSPNKVMEIASWCQLHEKQCYLMYGQTEATARISYLSPEKVMKKPNSIGQAIPRGRLWLEDDQGQVVKETEQTGQLCYAGDNVTMGLASDIVDLTQGRELTSLHTGDIAIRDDEGDYTIVGRLKRFIKIEGHRVNLDEIEQFLTTKDIRAACVGRDDLVVCLVDCNGEKKDVLVEHQRLVAKYLNIHSRYCLFKQIKTLPRLASGKIDYQALDVFL